MDRKTMLRALRTATLLFLPMAALAALVMALLYYDQASKNRTVTQLRQEKTAEIGESDFAQRLDELASDVSYLAEDETLRRWLATGDADDLGSLNREFLAFALNKPHYDQVRFIDSDGQERVRVDNTVDGAVSVLRDELQDKAGRPYVDDTLKLGRGEIYFSRFDLNIEHGEIEQPIKPMLRVATPVYDAQGRKRGLVILNYRGEQLLSRIRELGAQTTGDTWLVDRQGNWLLGPSAVDDWAFMYPDRAERSFANANPLAWQTIAEGGSGQFAEDGALFAYATIAADTRAGAGAESAPSREWHLIGYASPAAQPTVLTGRFLLGGGVVFVLLAITALVGAMYTVRRQQAKAEIEVLNRRLVHSEKMEALGQLTGGVAHDFNNLLAVIIGNAEILSEEIDDPELRTLAEQLMLSAEEGSVLTERLLAIGRRQALHPVPLDVGEVVESLEATLHRTLGGGITLKTAANIDRCIQVDRSQFESAIVNLALNAKAAMPEGGVFEISSQIVGAPKALAGELPPGHYAKVTVRDTGEGMSAETVEHVFDPFFTTKEIGKGAGMGLAMVYGFAKQSGGYAVIESRPGSGTSVHLYLPLVQESAPPQAVGPAKQAAAAVQEPASGSGQRILMAEDEPQLRTQVARLLRDLGYSVEEADSGAQALEILLANQEFDILFTDVVMPGGVSGIDLAQRARQLRPQLKVLLTTGYANASEQELASIDEPILKKPYRKQHLAEAIREALDRRAA